MAETVRLLTYWESCEDWRLEMPLDDDSDKATIDGVLVIPHPTTGKEEKVIRRKIYTTIWEMQLEAPVEPLTGIRGLIVTGTPGIGKSMMIFDLVYRLLHHPEYREGLRIVFHYRRGMFLLERGKRPRKLINDDEMVLFEPKTWYIVDGVEPLDCSCWFFMSTSPRRELYKGAQKAGAMRRYMPTFSDEEIHVAHRRCYPHVPKERVEYLLSRWGGVPRYVLQMAGHPDLDELLEEALASVGGRGIFDQLSAIERSGHEGVVHRIFHLRPTPEFYGAHIVAASEYVATELYNAMQNSTDFHLNAFILKAADMSKIASFRGWMFERQAHNLLSRGLKVRVRQLGAPGSPVQEWRIPQLEMKVVTDLLEALGQLARPARARAARRLYLQPARKNEKALDAAMVCDLGSGMEVMLLQMTGSFNHPVSRKQVEEAKEAACEKGYQCSRLVFVVPPDRFDRFDAQSYINVNKSQSKTAPAGIEQYVMEISLPVPPQPSQ